MAAMMVVPVTQGEFCKVHFVLGRGMGLLR